MSSSAILYAIEFNNYLAGKNFDAVIIRGDRFEMLGLAMVAAYKNIPIIHIEGGDTSGVIDNRVRHAITHLSDYHFCTNDQSHRKLINMGVPIDHVWNFGSLDVEFASKVKPQRLKERTYPKTSKPYILVAHHPIEGENTHELDIALREFEAQYDIIRIGSNTDYGKGYGTEQFSPEEYINLMRFASLCIGNSSSLIKEASILSVPVINIGSRQNDRLKPKNVLDLPCKAGKILLGIQFQLKNKAKKDLTYYQKDTSKKIVNKLKEVL